MYALVIWNQFLGNTRHRPTPWSGVAALRPEEDVIAVAGYRVILGHRQLPAIGTLSAIWMQAGAWFNRLNTTIRSARMTPTAVQRAARRVARNAAHLVAPCVVGHDLAVGVEQHFAKDPWSPVHGQPGAHPRPEADRGRRRFDARSGGVGRGRDGLGPPLDQAVYQESGDLRHDRLRGQRLHKDGAEAYEQAASAPNVGLELKIRSLLAAGQCRDLNSERQIAIKDYQAAVDAGPNTSRADAARKYLKSPYHGS